MQDKWYFLWDFSNKQTKRCADDTPPSWVMPSIWVSSPHPFLPCHLLPPEISDGPRSEWPVAIAPSFHSHSPPHCSWPRLQREGSPDSWTHATSSKLSLKNSRQHYLSWKRCRTPWLHQGGGNKMLDLELDATHIQDKNRKRGLPMIRWWSNYLIFSSNPQRFKSLFISFHTFLQAFPSYKHRWHHHPLDHVLLAAVPLSPPTWHTSRRRYRRHSGPRYLTPTHCACPPRLARHAWSTEKPRERHRPAMNLDILK